MNTNTLEKMRKMKFFGMFHVFKTSLETQTTQDYSTDELLSHLIEAEWQDRQNRRIERQLLYAKFRYRASIEQVFYHTERGIDRNQIMRLAYDQINCPPPSLKYILIHLRSSIIDLYRV